MSETTQQLKMLKELSDNKEIRILCDILMDYIVTDKEQMGFKGEKDAKEKERDS